MAGDWIKMRVDIGDDPAVISLSVKLNISEDEVVGKLHRLWSWADRHTTDGTAIGITSRWVDKYVSLPGFAEGLCFVDWIEFNESGVVFPNFDRHNGQSAKQRAEAAIRQRLSRKNRDSGMTGLERDVVPRPFVRAVLQRDGYQCVFCGVKSTKQIEESNRKKLSIDHLIPVTRGGLSAVPNLACACKQCNMEKSDRTPEEWGLLPTFLQDGVTYTNGQMSHVSCDKGVTREEKIRVSKPPISPKGIDVVFDALWKAYPRKVGKGAAEKAWAKLAIKPSDAVVLAAISAQRRSEQWQKDGGQFIPHPSTWISQRRWEDGTDLTQDDVRPSTDCVFCGATGSKRIGNAWYCFQHDQHSTMEAAYD